MSDEVIVVGGGLAGCLTALHLARAGVAVRVIEAGVIGGQASSANAGSLHAQIPHDPFRTLGEGWATRFAPAVTMLKESLLLWREMEALLGADLEVHFGGGLLVAHSEREMAEIRAKVAIERAAGLEIDLLDQFALQALAPYLGRDAVGGAFCAGEGKANPLVVTPAVARAAAAAGAVIEAGTGDVAIARDGEAYVLAAGSATGRLAAPLGAHLPIQAFPIQVSVTEPAAPLVPHLVYCAGAKLTLKQAKNGTLLIGGGWDARLDEQGRPQVDMANLSRNLGVAARVVPALGGLQLVRSWAAFVNGTDDWLPIIGELPQAPGVFINYVPWMGFSGGPAASLAVAAQVQGISPPSGVDWAAFTPVH
ncbi:NAD(P)/FAD-dependent oxidoreductase [Sandarakinorhabdus sp.]|uniref:NAD(P)/FAD-dependent oxidoreductase n=1 Tax=Sandarakinorhabdus sp. TaxID=1916663 RepID=UPI003F722DBA